MPRLQNFSAVNGVFDNITVKNINNKSINNINGGSAKLPYSLVVANTESLPEEGDYFQTKTYIPFQFNVESVTLQVNQNVEYTSKVSVGVDNAHFEFTITPNNTTVNKNCNMTLTKGVIKNIKIENMSNDDGDVSTCSVLLHGYVV